MVIYKTKDGDILDYICWKYYGHTSGTVEKVLQFNRHLENSEAILEAGVRIVLPEISNSKEQEVVRLWS